MKVVINPEYKEFTSFINAIPTTFKDSGEIIYKGRNELKRFVVNGTNLIVKSFKKPHVINRVVYASFRSSKAARSYNNAIRLENEGINTPAPIAYILINNKGLRESFYISKEVIGVSQIRDFCNIDGLGNYPTVFESFGRFTADMHKKGILHKDYSPGNILYTRKGENFVFYLVDINRMKIDEKVPEEQGYANFERLYFSNDGFIALAKAYALAMGYDEQHAVERICFYKNRFIAKDQK